MWIALVAGFKRRLRRDMKLILLVMSLRGSGIYSRPEGSGRVNCSSGRGGETRKTDGCLYICLPALCSSTRELLL